MESNHGVRIRVNVSTSTKGYHTWDATVEITDDVDIPTRAITKDVLEQSDALVAALEARYPNGERAEVSDEATDD